MTVTAGRAAPVLPGAHGIRFLELELTAFCQLTCVHCLTSSSPQASHGRLGLADWLSVTSQAAGLGIGMVQLIGGEPLTSPHAAPLIEHAGDLGLRVEVFSNLYSVTSRMWRLLARDGVSLATSVYSDHPGEHDQVTGKPGSFARNRANLREALSLGIPVRCGIVGVLPGQRTAQARADLEALGITSIKTDRVRAVGRAAAGPGDPDVSELCGRCGLGRAGVLPDGTLVPCVLGRFLPAGNVTTSSLAALLASPAWRDVMARIPRPAAGACTPADSDDCNPASTPACSPAFR
jgi:MoaA/NifB/PqqE/SkfB family radical SAM enzyme